MERGEIMSDSHAESKVALSDQELRLIQMVRELQYGELRIFVSDGKPIRAEEVKKSIKLYRTDRTTEVQQTGEKPSC